MLEDLAGRFERRLFDDGEQVFQSGRLVNRPVEAANAFAGDPCPGRMRIEDDRVARRDHADDIAGQRGERVGDRRDGADHAERGILGHREAVVAAGGVALEELDSRHKFDDLQFLDFVVEAADLRLLELEPA